MVTQNQCRIYPDKPYALGYVSLRQSMCENDIAVATQMKVAGTARPTCNQQRGVGRTMPAIIGYGYLLV